MTNPLQRIPAQRRRVSARSQQGRPTTTATLLRRADAAVRLVSQEQLHPLLALSFVVAPPPALLALELAEAA